MKLEGLKQSWDLDVLFEGGSDSDGLKTYIDSLQKDISLLNERMQSANLSNQQQLREIVRYIEDVSARIHEGSAYVGCLVAQDVSDKGALSLRGKFDDLRAKFISVMTLVDQHLKNISNEDWTALIESEQLTEYSFSLSERRKQAAEKLSFKEEALLNDLAVDGYHGWSNLYDLVVGKMAVPFQEEGDTKMFSIGQLDNKLSSQNRDVRTKAFEAWEKAWGEQADFCSEALNHLAGFRLRTYQHRNWPSVLKEPLQINRMSEETLNTMWQVIEENKPIFVQYLNRKAQILGLEKLSWYDVDAPIAKEETKLSYDDAANFILDQFDKLSPRQAAFSKQAFEKAWIEAEDRPGKRPGGFCTSFPNKKQTRIFMTYSGTPTNVSTLAHELGHGFHQHIMDELPYLNQDYAMNVAETASTFAEMVVADASVENAKTEEEQLALLEDKIQRSVAFFMNIHARFLFETRFYQERSEGLVSVERLNQLMEDAQKEAFCGALSSYHPHFWASKLHFYITDVPFYNFPYTFGYLFSSGIYAKAREEGRDFEEKYVALLQDTGRMTVEQLAQKHLGVDLTQPDFWQQAIELAVNDVKEFLVKTK
jgi:oligoendopeptidase F